MNKQPAPQLRLKPCGFRRHEQVCICHFQKFFDRGRIHGKCSGAAVFTAAFQLLKAADAADEVDPAVRARVVDLPDRRQDLALQEGYVKRADRVFRSLIGWDKMPVPADAPDVTVEFTENG